LWKISGRSLAVYQVFNCNVLSLKPCHLLTKSLNTRAHFRLKSFVKMADLLPNFYVLGKYSPVADEAI
jgi:hypothetical protein